MFNGLTEKLMKSAGFRQFIAEAEEVERTDRIELDTRKAIGEEREQTLPPLREALEKLRVKKEDAEAAFKEASARFFSAEQKYFAASLGFRHQISTVEGQLLATADPAIDAFMDEMHALWEETRHTRPDEAYYGPRRSESLGTHPLAVSNMPSIVARMDAIRALRREAEAVKLEVEVDVPTRLAELRESIPEIEPAETFIPRGFRQSGPPGLGEDDDDQQDRPRWALNP